MWYALIWNLTTFGSQVSVVAFETEAACWKTMQPRVEWTMANSSLGGHGACVPSVGVAEAALERSYCTLERETPAVGSFPAEARFRCAGRGY